MKIVSTQAFDIRLYMSGDINHAKQILRKECFPPHSGLCVTIEPTTFIYTGGEEAGFVIGFTNYPRFPTELEILWERAELIAKKLMLELCQWSSLITDGLKTRWMTTNPAS